MKRYVEQLLADITDATENVEWPYEECESGIDCWMSDEEEERTAPRRDLEEWTGVHKTQLPPEDRLTDEQVQRLLNALKAMLDAYNWSFVLQTCVPERIQYAAIRMITDSGKTPVMTALIGGEGRKPRYQRSEGLWQNSNWTCMISSTRAEQ